MIEQIIYNLAECQRDYSYSESFRLIFIIEKIWCPVYDDRF